MKIRTTICLALVFCFLIPSSTDAGLSIIGSLTHEKKTRPTETYKGSILIRNTGTGPQEIKIYQTDYQFYFDGSNIYGEPGKLARSNANWLSFNPHRLIIPPGDVSIVNYIVEVPGDPNLSDDPNLPDDPNLSDDPNLPDDPNLVGTYWSMLMVEGIPETSPESSKAEEGKAKVGITQVVRYAIQMVTHIGDTGERKLTFLKTNLLREAEKRVLQVDIENVGQRWLRPSLWTELYDERGLYIGKFEAARLRTYPGTSVRFKIDLSNVPKGTYKALIVADCGGDYIFGANYTLKFEK